MHEECLEFTLCEVDDAHEEREPLKRGCGRGGAVHVWAEEEDERVDEQRAEVFDNEDCAPRDLGTCGNSLSAMA